MAYNQVETIHQMWLLSVVDLIIGKSNMILTNHNMNHKIVSLSDLIKIKKIHYK